MKADIITRLKALENRLKKPESPDFVMMFYDGNGFTVHEMYNNRDAKGRITTGGTGLGYKLTHYRDYIFPECYRARVVLDTIGYPDTESGGVFSFSCDEIREAAGLPKDAPFSIACVWENPETLEATFDIIEYMKGLEK